MRNVGKYVMLCYVTISIFHYTCVFPTLMPFLIAEVGLTSCAVCTIQLCCVYNTVVLCVQYSCAVCTVQLCCVYSTERALKRPHQPFSQQG